MAKKIRFPLEMEDGIEVRSLEELRNNFSLSRVLGYINDGKLVTWLQDRYENAIADAIGNIDLKAEDAAKKICEIFDVAFDESAEDEIEKAEERKRKLYLLKKYPDCMDYAKYIDSVAFDQDDLYDLLDEDVKEIYLCGNRFSIPLVKPDTKYIGIADGVVVVIDSKQVVDFESKSISFVNCSFDEKYAQLLKAEEANTASEEVAEEANTTSEEVAEEANMTDNNPENDLDIDADELHDFVENLRETLEEFDNTEFENEDDELYEYDGSIECDADYYGGGGFSTKAKAKAACKEKLTKAIAEVKELYDDAKKELIDATAEYYKDMKRNFPAFLDSEFYESYEALLDVYCTGNTKTYLKDRLWELKKMISSSPGGWEADIQKKCYHAFKQLVQEHFDSAEEGAVSLKELFEMCEYDEEGDGEYGFGVDAACESLVDTYEGIIETEVDSFPESVRKAYDEIIGEYVALISEWITELENPQTKKTRRQENLQTQKPGSKDFSWMAQRRSKKGFFSEGAEKIEADRDSKTNKANVITAVVDVIDAVDPKN